MNSTRFTYTKDQVEGIVELLNLNGQSIARVFSIIFPNHCVEGWDDPVLVVDFIERVKNGEVQFPK
jgi:hypothetical protein